MQLLNILTRPFAARIHNARREMKTLIEMQTSVVGPLRTSALTLKGGFCVYAINVKVSGNGSCIYRPNSSLAIGDFRRLLIIFTNRLDTDQDRQNVGPDLYPNRLTF